jgi:hypothetical protein
MRRWSRPGRGALGTAGGVRRHDGVAGVPVLVPHRGRCCCSSPSAPTPAGPHVRGAGEARVHLEPRHVRPVPGRDERLRIRARRRPDPGHRPHRPAGRRGPECPRAGPQPRPTRGSAPSATTAGSPWPRRARTAVRVDTARPRTVLVNPPWWVWRIWWRCCLWPRARSPAPSPPRPRCRGWTSGGGRPVRRAGRNALIGLGVRRRCPIPEALPAGEGSLRAGAAGCRSSRTRGSRPGSSRRARRSAELRPSRHQSARGGRCRW